MGANDDDSTLSIGKKISAITNGEVEIIGAKIKFATKDSDGNSGSTFTMEQLVNEIGDPINGIVLKADQIKFTTTDGQPYATFKEAVTNIAKDVEIRGKLTATDGTTKVVTMINASDDVGSSATHGKLFIAAGMNGISTDAGIAAAKFKVYEDGTCQVKDLVATNADISGKITATGGTIGPFSIDNYAKLVSTYKVEGGELTGTLRLCGGFLQYVITGNSYGGNVKIGYETSSDQALITISDLQEDPGILIKGNGPYEPGMRIENAALQLTSGARIALDSSSADSVIASFKTPIKRISSDYSLDSTYEHTIVLTNNAVIKTPYNPADGVEFEIIVGYSSGSSTLNFNGNYGLLVYNGKVITSIATQISLDVGFHYKMWASDRDWFVVKS